MPAPISVVIPTLNAAGGLAATLAALMEGLDAGLIRELIVSDGGSEDETVAIADAAGAVIAHGPAGRGGQLARGCEAAKGDWILLLHADTQLSHGWAEAVAQHIAARSEAAHFRLEFDAMGLAPRIVARWANLRSRMFGLPYGDQGMLIRRAHLAEIRGVPCLPLMEDVALARALRGRLVALDAVACTSAERYLRDGWVRRGFRNWAILARYLAGADPEVLARTYRR